MKIHLKRQDDNYHMLATNEEGKQVAADGSAKIGGGEQAMRPMEMLIASLGSCSSIDVVLFLKKMRQPLEDLEIIIDAEREKDKVPALFEKIHVSYTLTGDLDAAKVEKAIKMSMEEYCSVAKIIEKTAPITWEYKIVKEKAASI